GNGMYNVQKVPGRYTKFVGSFGQPKLIFQMRITDGDGRSEVVRSDPSWKFHEGPITFSHAYGGEDFDARLEPEGWDKPGFKDDGWSPAVEVEGPGGLLRSQENPSPTVMRVYKPIHVREPKPGVRVYDLGQNFAGWPEVMVRGRAGSTVKLIPGELLEPSGLVTQKASGGPQWFSYVLKGGGPERWHPRFSYYGFRYVQVETTEATDGADKPDVLSLQGNFVRANVANAGEFSSSNVLFNGIHVLINSAIQSNLQNVLTDCPHREKLGWLEESHLLGSALMYGYDIARLYEKISDDMHDAQTIDGMVPEIAPEYTVFPAPFRDSPEWGSAVVLDPWITYQHYGDTRNLAEHYDDMKRYVEYLGSKAKDQKIAYGLGDRYDIGPGEPGYTKLTSLGLTATAIYYADITTLRNTALLLGKQNDAVALDKLAQSVRSSFNQHLYKHQEKVYDRGSQTALAMPLVLGLVPEEDRTAVLTKLVENIRQHDNHVTAGDIGFHYVVSALLDGGRSDVLYDMLCRTDSPSYGYQLQQGATTLTEAWDANPRHSQNHFMLGHAEEWFYRGLAGIDFDLSRPEQEWIRIKPQSVGDVQRASATYKSVLGAITSKWTRNGSKFTLEIVIPANAASTVYVPRSASQQVKEGGQAIDRRKGVETVGSESSFAIFRIGSGHYRFEVE
ncbi:MAG TPA: family 78 glycoside hydrolase catalytic domain, partial [Bryobacteraceae bacterium]